MTHKVQASDSSARRMRLRQVVGDFWRECCQMRMTLHPCRRSWRVTRLSRAMLSSRLLMLLPPASSTLRAAQQRNLSEPPLRFRVVPEYPVRFRPPVAFGVVVPAASAVCRRCVKCQDPTPHLMGCRSSARFTPSIRSVGMGDGAFVKSFLSRTLSDSLLLRQ